MNNTITITERLQTSWLWSQPMKLKWWLDLVLTAATETTTIATGRKITTINRGQVVTSLSRLCTLWSYTTENGGRKTPARATVLAFLKMLTDSGMITRDCSRLSRSQTLITITHFEEYAGSVEADNKDTNKTDGRTGRRTGQLTVEATGDVTATPFTAKARTTQNTEGNTNRNRAETPINTGLTDVKGSETKTSQAATAAAPSRTYARVSLSENINIINNNIKRERVTRARAQATFVPPTVEEVDRYIMLMGYTSVKAETFVKYYTKTKWKSAAGFPVWSWQDKARDWYERDMERQTTQPKKKEAEHGDFKSELADRRKPIVHLDADTSKYYLPF